MSEPAIFDLPNRDTVRFDSTWITAILLTLSATALGYSIHLRDGEYNYPGMSLIIAVHWVGITTLLAFAVLFVPRIREIPPGRCIATCVLAACCALQFFLLLRSPPSGWNPWSNDLSPRADTPLYTVGLIIAIVSAGTLLIDRHRVRSIVLPLILTIHLLLGFWLIQNAPNPRIDVFEFQQQSADALLHGQNPYRLTFADIYQGTDQATRPVYGHSLAKDGRLGFGFPYPPLSLLLALPGYLVAGDHRYSQAVAMTLAGAFIAYSRFTRTSVLAAVLFLFTPRAFFILGRAWTEPFVVCLLALVVLCACRGWTKWGVPIALGLFLASKQYLILAVPVLVFLLPDLTEIKKNIAFLVKVGVTTAIVTLPLALWDLRAFVHSLWTVQQLAPFREDALSYLVWIKSNYGRQLGVGVAFGGALVAMVLAILRLPRQPWAFALGLGVVFLPFIALNKQAFANYYFFPLGCFCAAFAALPVTEDEPG